MTTFSYRLVLNDCELIALEEALKHYRSFRVAEGTASYGLLNNIDAILGRLYSDTEQTSGFFVGMVFPADGEGK